MRSEIWGMFKIYLAIAAIFEATFGVLALVVAGNPTPAVGIAAFAVIGSAALGFLYLIEAPDR